jgi:regulator of protease activity HflC (stomatin/prohibitin superfamily)
MSQASPDVPDTPLGQSVGIAFTVLFVVVGLLGVGWLASGAVAVPAGERAVVLRLGNIDRELQPGLSAALPRPFEEVVLVPGPDRQLTIDVADLSLAEPDRPRAGDGLDLRSDGGYALTADGSVVHLGLRLMWTVADAKDYVRAGGRGEQPGQRIADLLRRTAVAAAIEACAGRQLDGVMVAGGGADLSAAAARDRLRSDILAGANRRLDGLAQGVSFSRIDLTTMLPPRAQRAYESVLAETQGADKRIAEARASADRTVQGASAAKARILGEAEGNAREAVAAARTAADRVVSLAAETAPDRRRLLITRLYRERLETILRNAGSVTAVDGRTPVRVALPGAER